MSAPHTSPTNEGMEVHWYSGQPHPSGSGDNFCEEYVTGDDVIDLRCDDLSLVTCRECLEWMHA